MSVSRRNVAKGSAWAAPVLMVAAAAPMVAASTSPETTVTGWACKMPGNSGPIKHGYRVTLVASPSASVVMPVEVRLGNGKMALIITDATRTGEGWEFVVDAKSSPSKLIVTVNVDGSLVTVAVKAHPHCTDRTHGSAGSRRHSRHV